MIFHSLGSQYTPQFCSIAVRQFFTSDEKYVQQLQKALTKRYHAQQVVLTYKGRDAIELAIRAICSDPQQFIFTQAFSCVALEQAILRAGQQVRYVDIAPNSTNLSVKTLEAARAQYGTPRAVIVQHSLGAVPDVVAIRTWCDKHAVVLIEDTAQSFGAQTEVGAEVGSWGDIVICSFGRDKIIDAVSGGACVVRTPECIIQPHVFDRPLKGISFVRKVQDLLYPTVTAVIRSLLPSIAGKVLYKGAQLLGILNSPITAPYKNVRQLPASHAFLALYQLEHLAAQQTHRTKLYQLYSDALSDELGVTELNRDALAHSHLRYSIAVVRPSAVSAELQKQGSSVSDRWYRSAVEVGTVAHTQYQPGSCPEAEQRAATVFNLPTHQGISEQDAVTLITQFKAAV